MGLVGGIVVAEHLAERDALFLEPGNDTALKPPWSASYCPARPQLTTGGRYHRQLNCPLSGFWQLDDRKEADRSAVCWTKHGFGPR